MISYSNRCRLFALRHNRYFKSWYGILKALRSFVLALGVGVGIPTYSELQLPVLYTCSVKLGEKTRSGSWKSSGSYSLIHMNAGSNYTSKKCKLVVGISTDTVELNVVWSAEWHRFRTSTFVLQCNTSKYLLIVANTYMCIPHTNHNMCAPRFEVNLHSIWILANTCSKRAIIHAKTYYNTYQYIYLVLVHIVVCYIWIYANTCPIHTNTYHNTCQSVSFVN